MVIHPHLTLGFSGCYCSKNQEGTTFYMDYYRLHVNSLDLSLRMELWYSSTLNLKGGSWLVSMDPESTASSFIYSVGL